MSILASAEDRPVESFDDLVAHFRGGEKPAARWRIGAEHEKIPFRLSNRAPVAHGGPDGIDALLRALADQPGRELHSEGAAAIGVGLGDGGNISLEPGGQFELSGAPLDDLHAIAAETDAHLDEVRRAAEPLGIGMLGLGFHPWASRAEMPWMPKGRYAIMRRYMPTRGALGLDMMLRTSTVQANLDYADEADMARKFRVALALQPVASAVFANSPFVEGRPTGDLSHRCRVWTDTDPDRTGAPDFVFRPGFGYADYAEWALDVPMYFVHRDGGYIDCAGASFRDFMDGRLAALPGKRPSLTDWANHLTTCFPDVRLKRYLEMRGADAGDRDMLIALPALWVGLLYDERALGEAEARIADWSAAERAGLRAGIIARGMALPFRDGTVGDLAEWMVTLASDGLRRRARLDAQGRDESIHLDPLIRKVAARESPAETYLRLYRTEWNGDVARLAEAARIS